MSNKIQMSLQDFQEWKEANSWFFDHLKELQTSLDEQVAKFARNVLVCPEDQLAQSRLYCAGLAGGAGVLDELINIEYSDIVEEEE